MYFPMDFAAPRCFSRFGQCEFLELDGQELDISNFHTRLIVSPSKEILVPTYHRHRWSLPEADIDATTLLSDLGQLAPTVVKEFIPKHYAERSFPLRLLNDIDFQGIEDGYIALSYCRKKFHPETPMSVVTHIAFGWWQEVDQLPMPTSDVIFQAVLQEKRVNEGIWYDQLCIDQNDEAERVASIGAIDSIYKNARIVIVALDDIAVLPEEERLLRYYVEQYNFSKLSYDQQPNVALSPPLMQQKPLLFSFLERILSSSWFDRAWCAHEMKSGQSHVFMVPCYTPYNDGISTVIRFTGAFFLHLLVLGSEVTSPAPAYHGKVRSLHNFFHRRISSNEDDHLAAQRPDTPRTFISDRVALVPTIAETFRLQAGGNPRLPEHLRRQDANRDKMGIALNASGLPLAITTANPLSRPDIEDECLRSLLLVGLAARDPVALCTTGTHLRLHDGSTSWLTRPTTLDVDSDLPAPPRFSKSLNPITQGSDGRAEYVQLGLVFLELPNRTQPSPNFLAHVSRARTYIDLCIQYKLPGSGLWNLSQISGHPRALSTRNIFIQTLACAFQCGSQWLLEVSSGLKSHNASMLEPHVIDVLLNPLLVIENYILAQDGQVALSRLLSFLSTVITSGIPWASGAAEHSHGPLIVTAPSSQSTYDANSSTQTHGGRAVLFAPFEHSKTLVVAVPAAVKDAHYHKLARSWVLTSSSRYTSSPTQPASWTLHSKGILFSDENFKAALQRCTDRRHRVYGPPAHRV
ncbi:hypothetical protein BDU57DRAFT_485483 [Ampelomyces quisqualis]|uniref:Heterokaryon incompatibility domain-containing protein n=1 Tax=Ampelomyces quisqualis TaxID=50730 RepID=A0A6A5Q698_AMPQU|nr:hypothetical protein BDU57DRAFT_485483 [Ampelomyces quisqualis]